MQPWIVFIIEKDIQPKRLLVLFKIKKEKEDLINFIRLCFVLLVISCFSMTLLRILCLHGYRQNGNMFREKTGSFRKLLRKHVAEFVFMDAPHLIPIPDNKNEDCTGTTASSRLNERGI